MLALYDIKPEIDNAWIAPNATIGIILTILTKYIVGEVIISKWASVWYNVTIRGEYNPIRIGHFSSIGDGTTITSASALPHGIAASVNIGKNVTIEAGCSLYSCIIDDDVVIGHNSVIMPGARLERGCQILPNSVVQPGRLVPAG